MGRVAMANHTACIGGNNLKGAAAMSGATTLRELQPVAGPQPIACRLRYKKTLNRLGQPAANHGEVELENLSATPLEIRYRMTALQYLNLVVTTSDGTVMSEGHFGDRFAPTL